MLLIEVVKYLNAVVTAFLSVSSLLLRLPRFAEHVLDKLFQLAADNSVWFVIVVILVWLFPVFAVVPYAKAMVHNGKMHVVLHPLLHDLLGWYFLPLNWIFSVPMFSFRAENDLLKPANLGLISWVLSKFSFAFPRGGAVDPGRDVPNLILEGARFFTHEELVGAFSFTQTKELLSGKTLKCHVLISTNNFWARISYYLEQSLAFFGCQWGVRFTDNGACDPVVCWFKFVVPIPFWGLASVVDTTIAGRSATTVSFDILPWRDFVMQVSSGTFLVMRTFRNNITGWYVLKEDIRTSSPRRSPRLARRRQ
jgi:hypothetical protein